MNSRAPRVTIGVPVYNGERYLAATLESLLRQTVGDFIVIVGDNASTDGTPEIAQEFAARDPRVRYVRHPCNLGAAANYNRLCEMAETEFFRWSAADDCSGPRFLEACLAALAENPDAVLVYPRIMLIDADGRDLRPYEENLHLPQARSSDRFFGLLDRIGLCNAMYGVARTRALRRTRLMGSYLGSDIIFQAELALYGKILEIPEVLLYRRMHDTSFTYMNPQQMLEFYQPGAAKAAYFYRWRHLCEHVRSLTRAPLPAAERMRLLGGLARRAVWGREVMMRELLSAGRALVTRKAP